MTSFFVSFRRRAIFGGLAGLVALCLLLPLGARAQGAPAGNLDNGKAAFVSNGCSGCHGDHAEGAMGPALAGTARTFSDFAAQVRKPKGSMPAFGSDSLADSQLADIYAFVKSLKPAPGSASTPSGALAAASSAASAPATAAEPFAPTGPGDAARGKAIFVNDGCFQCHGLVGQGAAQTAAPRIGPPPIPITVFAAYIRHPAGNMPPYAAKVVPDKDVTDIYAFLQSIKAPLPAKDIPLLNQ